MHPPWLWIAPWELCSDSEIFNILLLCIIDYRRMKYFRCCDGGRWLRIFITHYDMLIGLKCITVVL